MKGFPESREEMPYYSSYEMSLYDMNLSSVVGAILLSLPSSKSMKELNFTVLLVVQPEEYIVVSYHGSIERSAKYFTDEESGN